MNAIELGIFDTKTRLSEIIQTVEHGQVYYITKRGKRVAELRPIRPEKARLVPGCAKNDAYYMAPDFDETPADFDDYTQ
jgi:prevent-host-death family protein